MSDIGVEIAALRSAAKAAGTVSGEIDGLDFSELGSLGSSMPGADLEGPARGCSSKMNQSVKGIARGIDSYGRAMSSAAQTYESGEQEKATSFGGHPV